MKFLAMTGATALGLLAAGHGPAQAFHPFDQPSGYEMPDRLKKHRAGTPALGGPAPGFAVNNPPVLDGGGRPAISPSAPPVVAFPNSYGAGVIVIDTSGRALYYVLSSTTAYRYPISVGREGFTWTGTQSISRVASWPDWRPPAEMKQRKPGLPDVMTGGVRNPLGAKALYLGNSLYRIHGTNDTGSIGQAASSGCFRMMNGHVVHLASLAGVGTTVKVMNRLPNNVASKGSSSRRG
jgi:lipoprotein-anchoring transpeptidase ErfK/SrfK